MTITNRELHARLSNLQECARSAPANTYERAKEAAEVINDCAESIFEIFKAAGFNLKGDDGFRDLEVQLYALMLRDNPTEYQLHTAEGFGFAMDSPARDRVLAQTVRERDCLARILQEA